MPSLEGDRLFTYDPSRYFESRAATEGDAVLRATGILTLVGIAVIHFVQIIGTIEQTPWLGVGFMALIAGSMALAARLLVDGSGWVWVATSTLCLAAIAGYVFTRVMSTPLDNQDVGNWSETLGLAALFVEGSLLTLSTYIAAARRRLGKARNVAT